MSVFVAKVLNSNNNWESVSSLTDTDAGVKGFSNNGPYQYGFEHWLNNDILKDLKFGYLDCYRRTSYPISAERIILFNFDREVVWYVGNLYNVQQLKRSEIAPIRAILQEREWLQNTRIHFDNIGDNRELNINHEYIHHYNAIHIVGEPIKNPFILNIRYNKLSFLKQPINLTNIYPEINKKWKKLSIRYKNIPEELHRALSDSI